MLRKFEWGERRWYNSGEHCYVATPTLERYRKVLKFEWGERRWYGSGEHCYVVTPTLEWYRKVLKFDVTLLSNYNWVITTATEYLQQWLESRGQVQCLQYHHPSCVAVIKVEEASTLPVLCKKHVLALTAAQNKDSKVQFPCQWLYVRYVWRTDQEGKQKSRSGRKSGVDFCC